MFRSQLQNKYFGAKMRNFFFKIFLIIRKLQTQICTGLHSLIQISNRTESAKNNHTFNI